MTARLDEDDEPPVVRRQFMHFACHASGPLIRDWAAASYERMQAMRDYREANPFHSGAPSAWDDPYVKAARVVEASAWRAITSVTYRRKMTYAERMLL